MTNPDQQRVTLVLTGTEAIALAHLLDAVLGGPSALPGWDLATLHRVAHNLAGAQISAMGDEP